MFRRVIALISCVAVLFAGCEDDDKLAAGNSAETRAVINFAAVDAVLASVPAEAEASMDVLAEYISANTANDPERAYGVYRWIRNNVQADLDTAALDYIDSETQKAETVFQTRLAVCTGFANIFETLAEKAGFETVVIYGYGVMFYYDSSIPLNDYRHIWNGIKIGGRWFLTDLSWEPSLALDGSSDPNFFFMTDPVDFVYRHFPKYTKWQLLDNPVLEDEFWNRLTE